MYGLTMHQNGDRCRFILEQTKRLIRTSLLVGGQPYRDHLWEPTAVTETTTKSHSEQRLLKVIMWFGIITLKEHSLTTLQQIPTLNSQQTLGESLMLITGMQDRNALGFVSGVEPMVLSILESIIEFPSLALLITGRRHAVATPTVF